jgi:long-chain fatty acid transport protein
MKLRSISTAVAAACCIGASTAALATNGYMSHAYSPTAKGMAGAGEAALPQDTLSIVANPAGLTRVGRRADAGLAWFSPRRKYDGLSFDPNAGAFAPVGSGPTGTGTVESENNDFLIPGLGYTHPLNDNSAIGVALFANGGMNTDYRARDTQRLPPPFGNNQALGTFGGEFGFANPPHDQSVMPPQQIPGTQKLGGGDAGVNLEQLGVSIGYARDLADNVSVGASFLIGYQTIEIKGVGAFQGFTQTFTQAALAGRPMSPNSLTDNGKDSAWGYGFQVGGLWDVTSQLTLGASYRTKMYMGKFDKYSDLFANAGDFDMPAVGTIGAAFRATDQLTLALDVQQIWYGDVDAVSNDNDLAQRCNLQGNFAGYDSRYCLGGSRGAGFGWDDMTVLKLGVQYDVNDQLTLRGGYSHGNNPIDGSQVAFNALAPAVIEDHWTLGGTYRLRDNYELTFWGMYAPESSTKGPGAFTGTQAPEIRMSQYELGINFAWLFN